MLTPKARSHWCKHARIGDTVEYMRGPFHQFEWSKEMKKEARAVMRQGRELHEVGEVFLYQDIVDEPGEFNEYSWMAERISMDTAEAIFTLNERLKRDQPVRAIHSKVSSTDRRYGFNQKPRPRKYKRKKKK